jgi:hypothetical protein
MVCKYVNLIDISTLFGFGIETDAAGIVIPVTDFSSIGPSRKESFLYDRDSNSIVGYDFAGYFTHMPCITE